MQYYTGVGSRSTPTLIRGQRHDVLHDMYHFATLMETEGLTLRSGGARGADAAFEAGVANPSMKEIYYASDIDESAAAIQALAMAEAIHPAWYRCTEYVRKLHARNCMQVLGCDLRTPSSFLVCWTPAGEDVGGTRTAIILAKQHHIPVVNMFDPDWRDRIKIT